MLWSWENIQVNTNPIHTHTYAQAPNIGCTFKHTYLLCKPAGVGGEEALNAGGPQPLPWLGWMALTDLCRQGKERELARDGERMGEGDVAEEWCGKSSRIYVCSLCAGWVSKWYNVSVTLRRNLLSNCPVAMAFHVLAAVSSRRAVWLHSLTVCTLCCAMSGWHWH